jgi:hypothetical protein
MNIEQPRTFYFSWQSFAVWLGLTTAAFFLGADLHLQAESPTIGFNPRDFEFAVVGFVFGAISGLISGSLQWFALRPWLPNPRRWILANVIGFGLVHFLHDSLPYRPLDLWLILIIDGSIIGLAQYFVLRPALSRANLWVPIAAIGWFIGFQLGFTILRVVDPIEVLVERAIELGTAGLIAGVVTGVALKALLIPANPPPPARSSRWAKMGLTKRILLVILSLLALVVIFILMLRMLGLG